MAHDVDLERRGAGHAGHERRRPGQPGQRGRPARRAPGQPRDRHGRLRDGARPGAARPAPRVAWSSRRPRRSASPTTRAATPCWPTCSSTPTPCTRSPSSRRAWRSASPTSSRWRSATSTRASTSRTRCACAWAAAAPSSSSTATSRPGAANDLVGNTELARKMVREWGMSEAIGPDGLGLAGPGLPGRGPHAHPRLLRGHLQDHRRRGRADPARPRSSGPWRC